MDDSNLKMALALWIGAKRTSHRPHTTLPKTMRMAYTSPRQITRPVNNLVIGIAKPIEAKKRGRKMDSTTEE
jgi:hypothetical protein